LPESVERLPPRTSRKALVAVFLPRFEVLSVATQFLPVLEL
jgi:hypothetical protein